MQCRAVKIDIDDATDDGDRRVVVIHLADGLRSPVRDRPSLVAFVEMPPGMAREIAQQIIDAADAIDHKLKNG